MPRDLHHETFHQNGRLGDVLRLFNAQVPGGDGPDLSGGVPGGGLQFWSLVEGVPGGDGRGLSAR